MRNVFRCLIVVLIPATAASGMLAVLSAQSGRPRTLVLDNVRVIDGTGVAPIEHGRIVIEGDRLTRIGPRETVAAAADAETLDLSGRTIVPGLIDLHFHASSAKHTARRCSPTTMRDATADTKCFRSSARWTRGPGALRGPPHATSVDRSDARGVRAQDGSGGSPHSPRQGSGDPLRHIAEIRTVERVMAGGAWIDVARYRQY